MKLGNFIRFWSTGVVLTAPLGAEWSSEAQPANDNFTSASLIADASCSVAGSNVNATKETGEPNHAGNVGGRSIWYRWTAPSNGTVTFNTVGSVPDTLLAVYTGTAVNALTPVAAKDDLNPPDRSSAVTFVASAGTPYQIAGDGYSGAFGNISLTWLHPVITETVLALSVTNYSALVIDADANNGGPAYNRDRLRVQSQIRSANSSSAAHQSTWVTQYRLLDAGGNPHPILGENGVTNVGYVFNLTNTFLIGSSGTVTNTNSVALKPVARLNAYGTYAVEAGVFRTGSFTGAQSAGTAVWVFEKTKPLLTRAWNITWEVSNGSFRMDDPGPPRACCTCAATN